MEKQFNYIADNEFQRVKWKMVRYCVVIVKDLASAQLIVDECLEEMYCSGRNFDSKEHWYRYLWVSVRHTSVDHLRKKERERIIYTDLNSFTEISYDTSDDSEKEIRYKLVEKIISKLAPQRREIMTYCADGMSVKKIALLLNIKESSVRSARRFALDEIRKKLREKGMLAL